MAPVPLSAHPPNSFPCLRLTGSTACMAGGCPPVTSFARETAGFSGQKVLTSEQGVTMRFTNFLAIGAAASLAVAAPADAQKNDQPALDSTTFVHQFPEAYLYEGVARFWEKDYLGAARAWEQYLAKAGRHADTASVNLIIREALIQAYPETLLYEGVALLKAGDTLGAIRAWERLHELAPAGTDTAVVRQLTENVFFQAYPLARLYQGVAYYLANEPGRAISAWQEYLANGATEKERGEVRGLIAAARARVESERVAASTRSR